MNTYSSMDTVTDFHDELNGTLFSFLFILRTVQDFKEIFTLLSNVKSKARWEVIQFSLTLLLIFKLREPILRNFSQQIFSNQSSMTRNVIVTLPIASKILSNFMMSMETGILHKNTRYSRINTHLFLVPIYLRHIFTQSRHNILSYIIHDEHSHQSHLMIITHEIFLQSHLRIAQ